MNLVSTMITVAIVALLAVVAIPNWVQVERNAALSSAADEMASARLVLQRSAAEETGATLTVNGALITVTGNEGGGSWTGHLPEGAVATINGVILGCVALNGEEIPVTSPECSTTPPIPPLVWSISVEKQTNTLS